MLLSFISLKQIKPQIWLTMREAADKHHDKELKFNFQLATLLHWEKTVL